MRLVVEKHITTEAQMLDEFEAKGISNQTGLEFKTRMVELVPTTAKGFVESPLAYDAIWAVAKALNCTIVEYGQGMALQRFNYTDSKLLNTLMKCMSNVSFRGVSGQVKFTGEGDRVMQTKIEQMISRWRISLLSLFRWQLHHVWPIPATSGS